MRIQITDQTYHKTVTSVKKILQNGGVCVVVRAGDNSALFVHSSFPVDVLQQKLKLSKPGVKVNHEAVFFFNILGLASNAEVEQSIEDALNCNALGGFINAAAVCGSTLAVFTNPQVARTPDLSSELFTVALTFDRHHCPLSKALPLSKPYKLGVFGMWCSAQTLFTIKAALEEKLGDIGLISVMPNPTGRAVTVYVQGLENAIKARSKMVGIVKGLGLRCAPKHNRVLLFDSFGPHAASLHKEIKAEAARSKAAEFQELLDPQIASPNPDQALMRTSVINTLRNLGHAATVQGCVELVFNLNGVKCVSCAGKIRQAIQQGPQQHLSGYLNLYRNRLTVKTFDDVVEDSVAQIVKALRAIKVQADLVNVSHDISDEPDPGTEEESSILRRLCGKTLLRKATGEDGVEAFSDDSDMLHAMNSPITTAAFHITGLTCQSCALLLRGTVKTILPGVTSCAVDFASRTLYASYGSEATSPEEIREKLGQLGHATALLREGEDLKLKLTDTLWANENAAVPAEDETTQAMLDSQLLLYELQPQLGALQPLLELKHYATLEETGVDAAPLPSGSGAPGYSHVSTIPVHLVPDPKDPKDIAVYLSIFSQVSGELEDNEDENATDLKGSMFDAPREGFFLVMQSPNGFNKDAQALGSPTPGADYLEPPTLHFAHPWTFWFDVTVDTKEKNAEDSLRQLGTFHTLQDLWKFWNHLCISNLKDGCNLRLFREDVQPTWEHPMNRNGGRWSARSLGKSKRFKLWTEVVLALVGEQLTDNSEHHVCGVCLSSKPGGDRIEVWVDGGYESQEKAGSEEAAPDKEGDAMDELLRKMLFPDEDKKYFFYQSHLDYIEQRKTQRGGRRAKARKQNQLEPGYEQEGSEEAPQRYYPEYEGYRGGGGGGGGAPHHYGGPSGGGYNYPPRNPYSDPRSGGVLAGPRPGLHMMAGKGYGHHPHHPPPMPYYGGKGGHMYHGGKGHHPGYPPPQHYGGYATGPGKGQWQMHRPQMYLPGAAAPPTMTPGEADNILAMHSMSGSGLTAPEPPPWSMDIVKPPSGGRVLDEEEEDFDDPTNVGMEVGQLLEELHLEQYTPVMVEKGYEDWTSMQELSEADLEEMGMKPGHRKRLLATLHHTGN